MHFSAAVFFPACAFATHTAPLEEKRYIHATPLCKLECELTEHLSAKSSSCPSPKSRLRSRSTRTDTRCFR
ncbi:hypothetical protein BV25DRAFT_1818931 [Artomyces pyxidatus]|uniref:Uncharacterized protein n=1 Tax=Artomyces pyxidatus TaxID=48021 RepID=A0ACB8TGJ6_9AGAM|nr:hypothetical protein BV25DRAFT_1818931 [Artomyces pyxidatus]